MADSAPEATAEQPGPQTEVGGSYARYVLGILVVVYIFNFIDRQLITVLATDLRADLGMTDAQIGFLYGTAFAVFYAIFGIPLGKVADVWVRRSLIAFGLALWSFMTALSGLTRNMGELAAARIGVAVGESSATPAAFSMLSDYFPPERRATALAIYSSGVFIGAGIGIFLGGWILELWKGWYPDPALAPFGLKGWQVAFLIVGLPGILMALWVGTLREPERGMSEGLTSSVSAPARPFAAFWGELRGLLPGFAHAELLRLGGGARAVRINLIAAAASIAAAVFLIWATGTPEQWIALAGCAYAAFSWAQGFALRDPPSFELIFRSRALVYSSLGFSFMAFTGYGLAAFFPSFFQRIHGAGDAEVGTVFGLISAGGGWLGVVLGGLLSDRLKPRTRHARLWIGVVGTVLVIPFGVWMLSTPDKTLAYILTFPVVLLTSCWPGAAAATVQDLVLPRMRAVAAAVYILVVTFIGLALGPYAIGRISDATGDLSLAMMLALSLNIVALLFLLLGMRHLAQDEDTRLTRARTAGEPNLQP